MKKRAESPLFLDPPTSKRNGGAIIRPALISNFNRLLNYLLTLSQFGVHLLHGTHCGFSLGSSDSGTKLDASTKSCLPENSMDTLYESGTSVVSDSPFGVVSAYFSFFSLLFR